MELDDFSSIKYASDSNMSVPVNDPPPPPPAGLSLNERNRARKIISDIVKEKCLTLPEIKAGDITERYQTSAI